MTTGMMDVAHLYLSMEIGGTNLRYGVLDETFRVLDFKKEPSRYLSDAEDKGEYIEGLVRPYIERYGKEDFLCMTLSLASLMNRERTINNISLVDILTERTGLGVFMERDVNTALLYEIWKGHIDKRGIIIGIFIGTGLGNAMCIDGKVYIGNTGSACELGHIPVLGFTDSCGCGKKGCLEQYASANGLVRVAERYIAAHRDVATKLDLNAGFTAKDVCDAAKAGDAAGIVAVEQSMKLLGKAMAAVACVMDPEVFVVGGGLSKAGSIIIDTAAKYYKEYAFHASRETEIKLATLGNSAGMYGGVKMVIG